MQNGESGMNGGAFAVTIAAATLGILVRLVFLLTLPLIENDATIVFQAARELLAGRALSMVQTLPALVVAALWKFTGESLFVASLPNFLAGIGTVALCYAFAKRCAGKTAGAMAAMVASAAPIAILFDSITKPYSLLSFFILAGIWCWQRGIDKARGHSGAGLGPWAPGVLAGLFFAAAFACHTFAAFASFPLALFFLAGIISKRRRPYAWPSLAAGLAFGAVCAVLVAWRFPVFGWSVFNDYVTDWRFAMETAVWSSRWEGLTNLFALAPFFLAPGVAIFLARGKENSSWPAGAYLLSVIAFNVLVYLVNPVNHFPRALLPSIGPLAIFAGIGLESAARTNRRAWYAACGACVLGAIWLAMETATGRVFITGLMNRVSPVAFLVVVAVIVFGFFALGKIAAKAAPTKGIGTVSVGVFAIAALVYGTMHAHGALSRQASYYQGRLAALRECKSDSNILGGGDTTALLFHGKNNYAWLTDLPDDKLRMIFTDGLVAALESAGITCVVVARQDPEGEQEMLREYAGSRGLTMNANSDIYQQLRDNPEVVNLIAGGNFSTFLLPRHEWSSTDIDKDLLKRYSPLIASRLWR